MKKAFKLYGSTQTIVTDSLRSSRVEMTEIDNVEKQEIGRCANNGAENSNRPFRRR